MFTEYDLIEMKLADNADLGVAKMSFVNNPAVGIHFVAMSEQDSPTQILIKASDDEKRIVTGVAMVPDAPFLREGVNGNPPYKAFFSADTIEKVSQKYLSDFNQKKVNTEHSTDVEDVVLCESWIVSDEDHDKTKALNLSAPVGSWVTSYKVNNDDLWDDVKAGKYKGLSIEGLFEGTTIQLSEHKVDNINTKNKPEMTKKDDSKGKSLLTKVRDFIDSIDNTIEEVAVEAAAVVEKPIEEKEEVKATETEEAVEIKAEKVAEVSYWWTDVVDGTSFALDSQILRKPYDEDGEAYPITAGEYETEDGTKILVDSEGYVRYIFDSAKKEEVIKEEVKEEVVEDKVEEVAVEAAAVETETVKEEVAMVAHTDAPKHKPYKPLKFDPNMTPAERIKAQLRNQ